MDHDKQIDILRTNFRGGKTIVDPAKIINAGEWYLLDHISSSLVEYDHEKGLFEPVIAESWEIKDEFSHIFRLKKNFTFHDGTHLVAEDVAATIKHLLIQKTSTHFPLWEYLEDCEKLVSINDQCQGVQVVDDHAILFKFKKNMKSFYLQLASPETGIWAAVDIRKLYKTDKFEPNKFSGPYFVKSLPTKENDPLVLKRSSTHPKFDRFVYAPEEIHSFHYTKKEAISKYRNNDLDLYVDYYQPFDVRDWSPIDTKLYSTSQSVMIYFRASHPKSVKKIGADFFKKIWSTDHKQLVFPAESFLPFGEKYNLSRDEFLSSLPPSSSKSIKFGFLEDYFNQDFIDFLIEHFFSIGVEATAVPMKGSIFNTTHFQKKNPHGVDFLLSPYAASERYPSVQLRFISGRFENKEVFDLKKVEGIEIDGNNEIHFLKSFQKHLLSSQIALPIFFHSMEIVYRKDISIGNQPKTDAEMELWRVESVND